MPVGQPQLPTDAVVDGSRAREVRRIYGFLLDQLALSDAHRRELLDERAFTNSMVTTLKFRTVCRSMQNVEKAMRDEFLVDDLMAAGVLEQRFVAGGDRTEEVDLSGALSGEGILIPYLDEVGECYYLRWHKRLSQSRGCHFIACQARVQMRAEPNWSNPR